MLRIEKMFEEEGIRDELDAYNPLVPDGTQLEGDDDDRVPDDRTCAGASWLGLRASRTGSGCRSTGCDQVYAIADEDLERENEEKTSSVHFLRFEFTPAMIDGLKKGAALAVGIDHPNYPVRVDEVAPGVQASLVRDFA